MKETTNDNKNEKETKHKIELKDYDVDLIGQDIDSNFEIYDDNITESMPESNNNNYIKEEKEEILPETKNCCSNFFINYFDYFIAIILFINSFIYFSYLNIIHIIFSIFLVNSKYSLGFNFFVKYKGKFTIIVLFIEFAYLIFKIIIDAINSSKNENEQILKDIFPISWASIYEYVFISLIIILFLVYLILKDFSEQAFTNIELIKNKKFLETKLKNNSNILNTGLYLIVFGSTISPSVINLVLLILALIFFFVIILVVGYKKVIKKNFCMFYLGLTCLYIIYNYILNFPFIKADSSFGKIILFEQPDQYFSIFTMILFLMGIYCLNINLKINHYLIYSQIESLTLISQENIKEEKEEEMVKLSDTFVKTKNEIKLETLFATDIDCGIIVFSKESKKYNLKKRIKLFILKFCYTPGFCLHACRLSAILWINLYMTYVSILLIIWLLISIKY